jgi:hypothetical protein
MLLLLQSSESAMCIRMKYGWIVFIFWTASQLLRKSILGQIFVLLCANILLGEYSFPQYHDILWFFPYAGQWTLLLWQFNTLATMPVRCNGKNYNSIVICLAALSTRHPITPSYCHCSLRTHATLTSSASLRRHHRLPYLAFPNRVVVSITHVLFWSRTPSFVPPQPNHHLFRSCHHPFLASSSCLCHLDLACRLPNPSRLLWLCRSIVCYLNVDHFRLRLTSLDRVITPAALFHSVGPIYLLVYPSCRLS